jgi:hypothetical protein
MAPAKEEVKDTGVASNDAYTGMLVISLLALIVGSVLLYLDWSQYPTAPQLKAVPEFRNPKGIAPAPPGPEGKKDGVPPNANPDGK